MRALNIKITKNVYTSCIRLNSFNYNTNIHIYLIPQELQTFCCMSKETNDVINEYFNPSVHGGRIDITDGEVFLFLHLFTKLKITSGEIPR